MIRPILKKDSKILTTPCKPVEDFQSAQSIIQDLLDTIEHLKTQYDFPRGIGLAAPQIGALVQISVAEYRGQLYILINPEIIETSEEKRPIREGCISFLAYRGQVPRYTWVKVKAFSQGGEEYEIEGEGDLAMLLQHEVDHLNGILYVDHLEQGEADLIEVMKDIA